MTSLPPYAPETLSRADVDALPGATVLEFGANWCSICQGATPAIAEALAASAPGLRHLRVEDGPGRPLGRSYRVKLWPTLVVLQDGREVARVVRPQGAQDVAEAIAALAR
jgi:thioredoxin 1